MKLSWKLLLIPTILASTLMSCENTMKIDYVNEHLYEAALNEGINGEDKVVQFTVDEIAPNSAFGYNLMTGDHLNFVSVNNPNKNIGDEVIVKTLKVSSFLGSYIISYELMK